MPFHEATLLGRPYRECSRCGKSFNKGETPEQCQEYCDRICPDRGIPGMRVATVNTGIVAPSGAPIVREEELAETPPIDEMPDLSSPMGREGNPEL